MFYDNFKKACEKRGYNITTVLAEIGRASGNTGTWKIGKYPRLDIVIEMAQFLGVSLDEFVFGDEGAPFVEKTHNNEFRCIDEDWIEIINGIPEDKQQLCKDFLRTHMTHPQKYTDSKRA